MYRISELARRVGLSRSTLLYYDRIGLLSPTGRSRAGYRLYSEADRERLVALCGFRAAGLGIEDIRRLLADTTDAGEAVIRRRLEGIGEEIRTLQAQQRLLVEMLHLKAGGTLPAQVDRETWVEMLRAAGMDDAALESWHAEFEARAPGAHHAFLLSLGIEPEEAERIRGWSRLQMERRTQASES